MPTEIRLTDPVRDEPAIIALWRRNFEEVPEERFGWLYRAVTDGSSIYLGLWSGEGQLIGGAGVIPRRLHTPAGTHLAGQAVDLVVDRAFRSAGPAIKLHREAMAIAKQSGMILLYGFPIPASEAVLKRLGYKELGIYGRWIKPFHYHYLLKRRMPAWLAAPAAVILDLATRLTARETWSRLPPGWQSELLGLPDERFDAFWHRNASRYPVSGSRDRDFLEWRFFRQPGQHRRIFTICDADGRLKAYLVFQESSDRFGLILDFLADDNQTLGILLTAFARHARSRKMKSLTLGFLGDEKTKDTLRWAGFVARDNKDAKVLVSTPDKAFLDPRRWYLTDADRDT